MLQSLKLNLTTIGSMNFNVLRNILVQGNILKLNRGAEVGVLYGDTSAYLLKELPSLTLLSIDPYVTYKDDRDGRPQAQLSEYEAIARDKLAQFGTRSQIIKEFSVEAARTIEDESLDFVFIDANHTYDSVREDIEAWYPKVRKDGLFCGHDYRSFPGVTQAVEEFAMAQKLPGFCTPIESDLWFFIRPS
jgi:hypothetical protein